MWNTTERLMQKKVGVNLVYYDIYLAEVSVSLTSGLYKI